MGLVKTSAGIGILLTLTFGPVYGAQKGNSGNHGPKATTHGPSTTTVGQSANGHAAQPAKGPSTKSTVKVAKVDAKSAAKSAKSDAKSTTASNLTTTAPTTTTTTGTTAPINFTSGPVGEKLSKNTALRSKLETRLTSLGYTGTAYQAAYGFKNLGQFVAATNVSRNLGIPFDQLKLQMTGLSVKPDGTVLRANLGTDGKVSLVAPALATNPAPTKSLGQSIQTVKSNVDGTAAAQTATTQANAEIESTTANR